MPGDVGREPQYEVFADEYASHAADGFYNAYLDRPACLSLLGDVNGRVVLDAACGPGLYAEQLCRQGAQVICCDQSARMVELCSGRLGAGSKARVHDLADPLDWLEDASVDLVLLALAIEYVDDRVSLLRELNRVLRPGGALVLSRQHPTADWLKHGGDYHTPRVLAETWSKGWNLRYWLASLERTCEELHEAGFLIERLLEPRPVAEAESVDPQLYAELSTQPGGFIAIRAVPAPRR